MKVEGEGEGEGPSEARLKSAAQHLPLHARFDRDGAVEAVMAIERRFSPELGVAPDMENGEGCCSSKT